MIARDIVGKVVLITGASGGIGAATVAGFASQGARTAIHYHSNRSKADALVSEIRANGGEADCFQADLAKSAGAQRLFDDVLSRFGRVDVLINIAGGMVARRSAADIDDAYLESILDLNVRSVVMMCQRAIHQFRRQGGGNIINVGSSTARGRASAGLTLYGGAKGFILSFSKNLAKELAKENIRVNVVSPGPILTPAHDRLSTQKHLESLKNTIPLGRVGKPEDCFGAFLYLASDSLSEYVTGAVIDVSGGL